jgi:hypothetical protein
MFYNVTLERLHETIVAVVKQKYYTCFCVRARGCARVSARVVRTRMHGVCELVRVRM